MSYSNGTPAPGDAVEVDGRLYLVTGLDEYGRILGTGSTQIAPLPWQSFGPQVAFAPRPNLSLIDESEVVR